MLVAQPDARLLIDSFYIDNNGKLLEKIERYKANGKIDAQFGNNGYIYLQDLAAQIYLDDNAKILIPLDNTNKNSDTVYIKRYDNNVHVAESYYKICAN